MRTLTRTEVSPFALSRTPGLAGRRAKSAVATFLFGMAFVVALVPLIAVIWYVVQRGWSVVDLNFLTKNIPTTDRTKGPGMGPAIVGTLLITGGATVIAVPLGVLGAIYLHEYGGASRLTRVVRFFAEVMTGVPSIVMGLFVYTALVLRTKELNGLAGSIALACLMLPIIIRTSEEMLRLVPLDQREASLALGARKVTTTFKVVLPAAAPGMISGVLLAIARAAGETAPLLFTIGVVTKVNTNLFSGTNTTLSAQIFRNAASPFVGAQDRAWGAALTLICIVFIFTMLARLVSTLLDRRMSA